MAEFSHTDDESVRGDLSEDMGDNDDMGEDVDLGSVNVSSKHLIMDQYMALVEACERGDETDVRCLLEEITEDVRLMLLGKVHTKEFDEGDKYQGSILQHAVCGGNMPLLQYLASHPCTNLEEVTLPLFNTTKSTALTQACKEGNLEAAVILLESGCDPNHGYGFSTPLIHAVDAESNEIVALLLEYGADPTHHPFCETNQNTSLPFYIACLQGNLDIVETLLIHLNDSDHRLISLEQLVLCRSILGLHLIDKQTNIPAGISLWQKSIDDFLKIAQTRGYHMAPSELSGLLHSLYLKESCLVQTGHEIELPKDFFFRTHTRFPDFKLCVRSSDINSVFQANGHITQIHSILIRSCVSTSDSYWKFGNVSLSILSSILNIADSSLSKENKRLCLLLVLETGLLLEQAKQIINSVTMAELLSMVIDHSLYPHNPGYLMLILDIFNCAIEQMLACCEQLDERETEKIGKSLMKTGDLVGKFTYLILREPVDDQQSAHLTGIVKKYVALAQEAKKVYPAFSMECQLLITTVSLLLSLPDDFRRLEKEEHTEKTCLKLVHSLLRCGVNPNSRDEKGNTIMLLTMGVEEPSRSDIIELLMAYGGHVDVTNYAGNSAYQILLTLPDNRVDPLLCRTLKCRAASAVSFFKIPFRSIVPPEIETFIALHDTHTRTTIY